MKKCPFCGVDVEVDVEAPTDDLIIHDNEDCILGKSHFEIDLWERRVKIDPDLDLYSQKSLEELLKNVQLKIKENNEERNLEGNLISFGLL